MGLYGALWGSVCHLWVSLCHLWVSMCHLCVSMGLYVSLMGLCVPHIGLYGSLWFSMGLYVPLMGLYVSLMGLYVSLWVPVGRRGALTVADVGLAEAEVPAAARGVLFGPRGAAQSFDVATHGEQQLRQPHTCGAGGPGGAGRAAPHIFGCAAPQRLRGVDGAFVLMGRLQRQRLNHLPRGALRDSAP